VRRRRSGSTASFRQRLPALQQGCGQTAWDICPWAARRHGPATGGGGQIDARRARRLLVVSRLRTWNYRVLLRAGRLGVTHAHPRSVKSRAALLEASAARRERDLVNMLHRLAAARAGTHRSCSITGWTRTPGACRRAFGRSAQSVHRVADSRGRLRGRRGVATTWPTTSRRTPARTPGGFAETSFALRVAARKLRELFSEFGRNRKGVV